VDDDDIVHVHPANGVQRAMSKERNKVRMLELVERVLNGHDIDALSDFTANPSVIGSASGLVHAFPDLTADVGWIVAEDEMVAAYLWR
jgi:hypothetical protein